jgi:hypothetical protein
MLCLKLYLYVASFKVSFYSFDFIYRNFVAYGTVSSILKYDFLVFMV